MVDDAGRSGGRRCGWCAHPHGGGAAEGGWGVGGGGREEGVAKAPRTEYITAVALFERGTKVGFKY